MLFGLVTWSFGFKSIRGCNLDGFYWAVYDLHNWIGFIRGIDIPTQSPEPQKTLKPRSPKPEPLNPSPEPSYVSSSSRYA